MESKRVSTVLMRMMVVLVRVAIWVYAAFSAGEREDWGPWPGVCGLVLVLEIMMALRAI